MSVPQQDWHMHDGPWTEDDFLALPEDRGIELLDGELLMSPYASIPHQRLASRLWLTLDTARPTNIEVLESVNVRVGHGRILIPDLAITGYPGADGVVIDAADVLMVVEIVSPGSVAADRAIKPRLYAEAGIPHYLRIELNGPTGLSYSLRAGRYVADEAGSVLRLSQPFPVEIDLPSLACKSRR